jgi:CBS-domain-containing membrane protein
MMVYHALCLTLSPLPYCAVQVACAIAAMMALGIPHPPGGGTALIAVTGDEAIVSLGWMYILMPAGVGAIILVVIGMLLNNLHPHRQYPIYWY